MTSVVRCLCVRESVEDSLGAWRATRTCRGHATGMHTTHMQGASIPREHIVKRCFPASELGPNAPRHTPTRVLSHPCLSQPTRQQHDNGEQTVPTELRLLACCLSCRGTEHAHAALRTFQRVLSRASFPSMQRSRAPLPVLAKGQAQCSAVSSTRQMLWLAVQSHTTSSRHGPSPPRLLTRPQRAQTRTSHNFGRGL